MFRSLGCSLAFSLALCVPTAGQAALVDTAAAHSCAVVDGGVRCWGDNADGALGNPSFEYSALAVDVVGLEPGTGKGVTSIATTRGSSCAVMAGGVLCWGNNSSFQLGNGTADHASIPTPVSGLEPGSGKDVVAVAIGLEHACAVESGGVLCWGKNSASQLGDGTQTQRPTPVSVTGLEPGTGKGVVAVAAGAAHTCAAGLFGLKCWGMNPHPAFGADHISTTPLLLPGLPGPISVVDISINTTCVVTGNALKCWGSGPLGDGTQEGSDTPVTVPFLPPPITAVSVGDFFSGSNHHSCAIASGIAYCWGRGEYGQLGDGDLDGTLLPVPVQNFDAANGGVATEIAAGEMHTCGLHSSQGLRCWGGVSLGFLGEGSYSRELLPVPVVAPAGASRLAASSSHTCALIASKAWCWGDNADGELGDGSRTTRYAAVQVANLNNVTSLSTGARHSCAVQAGQVWCWGSNANGQLGQDPANLQQSDVPVAVTGLSPIAQIVGGDALHTCAITTTGALYCWGDNTHGQTGSANPDGSANQTDSWKPHLVLASGVTDASVAATHTCAIVSGGVACWGLDIAGELGNGPAGGGPSPSQVVGLDAGSGATMVSTGNYYTCAVIDGGAQCWGIDYDTFVSSGTVQFSDAPQSVGLPAGSGVSFISTSTATTCAIVAGTAKCWGKGIWGSLGVGDTRDRDAPAAIPTLSNVVALSTTGLHSCAISAAAVQCWGWTMDGRLGTGATGTGNLPAAVIANTLFRSGFE